MPDMISNGIPLNGLLNYDTTTLCPVSKAVLPIIRHFLNALSEPKSFCWRIAQTIAVGTWGEARGLAIAYDTQKFLTALLLYRKVPLNFNDPLNLELRDQLQNDEVAILKLLIAMQADQTAQARVCVLYLTQGQMRAAVVQSALTLAKRLEFNTSNLNTPKRPTLRIVK